MQLARVSEDFQDFCGAALDPLPTCRQPVAGELRNGPAIWCKRQAHRVPMAGPSGASGRPTGYQGQAHRVPRAGPFGTNGRPISAFLSYESLPPPPSWRHKWEIRHLGGGRQANWDNGRLVRCRSRTWTVHGTGETPVLPVKAPRVSTNWESRLPGGGDSSPLATARRDASPHLAAAERRPYQTTA